MFYPLLVELANRRVLVVGGGLVAERKVDGLIDAGAAVVLVSPRTTAALRDRARRGLLEWRRRKFAAKDLEGAFLVISATGDRVVQRQVAAAARRRRVWINTVDEPELCDFIVPAVVRRGDVVIGISTSGKSPALAAELRRSLDAMIGGNVARVVHVLGAIRPEVHAGFADAADRKRVFQSIIESGILEWIDDYDDEAALARVRRLIGGLK